MLLRKKRADENLLKDKVASKLAQLLLKTQVKFSKFMSACVNKVSTKGLRRLLFVFCLLGGGCSIYLITGSIFKDKTGAFKIEKINVPKVYDGGKNLRGEQVVDEEIYKAIEKFERYMDSLGENAMGLQLRDSILKLRPGLMDSFELLKKIYKSQN